MEDRGQRRAPGAEPGPGLAVPRADRDAIIAVCDGRHGNPFGFLGPHRLSGTGTAEAAPGSAPPAPWVVRAFLPNAESVRVLLGPAPPASRAPDERSGGGRGPGPVAAPAIVESARPADPVPMERLHPAGFFEAILPAGIEPGAYRLRVTWSGGAVEEIEDPYRFPPVLGDLDLHLIAEGTHLRLWEKLGAHVVSLLGVEGIHFAVWAPNAAFVSVIGDFNFWDKRRYPMRLRPEAGVWEIFVPGVAPGARYKYEIVSKHLGYRSDRCDPLASEAELRPGTASIVGDPAPYAWTDAAWLQERRRRNALDAPMAIYEVHLGSWRRRGEEGNRWLTYAELAETLVPYAKEMGFTHLELLPITEHPFDGSWGYQTTGYFAPTSRFGSPREFMKFVDACHRAGLGVLLDWVPSHFPKDGHALAFFDGTHLYEHEDPRLGEHPDWGTKIFNFGRTEVRNFLLADALHWIERYHIDGLRVDAVASMLYLDYSRKAGEWLPNRHGGRENLEAVDFLKRFNEVIHAEHPDVITVAEESTAWPMVSRPTWMGGLGFDLKWNMGWMHDMLEYMSKDPIHRRFHHHNITFSMVYAFTENFVLPLSHDEVVHGKGSLLAKMPGDLWRQFANLRALFGFMFGHPGKKLLFMGDEFGPWSEWSHDAGLDWHLLQYPSHEGLRRWVRDLAHRYRAEPALHEVDFEWQGFEWIDFHDADGNIVAFLRRGKDPEEMVLVVCNFSPVPRDGYRLGVPKPGLWVEILNSDAEAYGGSNTGNLGGVCAEEIPFQGRPCSATFTVPPLATIFLKPA